MMYEIINSEERESSVTIISHSESTAVQVDRNGDGNHHSGAALVNRVAGAAGRRYGR